MSYGNDVTELLLKVVKGRNTPKINLTIFYYVSEY